MEPFLIFTTLQVVIFIAFWFKAFKKESKDQLLLIILFGCAIGLFSKILILYDQNNGELIQGISSSICFVSFAFLYIRNTLQKQELKRRDLMLISIPYTATVVMFVVEHIFKLQFLQVGILEHARTLFYHNFRKVVIVSFFLADMYWLWRFRAAVRERIQEQDIQLSIGFAAHSLFLSLLVLLAELIPESLNYIILFVGLASSSIVILMIVYFKFIRPYSMQLKNATNTFTRIKSTSVKYQKSHVDLEMLKGYADKLEFYIANEKPYLNAQFNLSDLATGLGISNHDLSMVFSHVLQTNFYSYINAKRIAFFIKNSDSVLKEERTILALAYASGFQSKSTFNKYFKQETGFSPTEFLKNPNLLKFS